MISRDRNIITACAFAYLPQRPDAYARALSLSMAILESHSTAAIPLPLWASSDGETAGFLAQDGLQSAWESPLIRMGFKQYDHPSMHGR